MKPVRCVYVGTAEIACPSLARLVDWPGAEVVGVVTQPDRPAGRHLQLQPSPVKRLALERGLPVLQPQRVREPGFLDALRAWAPELVVVMAFGQILPASVLQLPRYGCVNLHASLLPKYRGAAPIQWALANGETETGVTLMLMDEGMDTGPILARRSLRIQPGETAGQLHDRLAELAAELLVEALPEYLAGRLTPQPQPAEGVSYAPRLRREHGRIDWSRPAVEIERRIRAFDPWPGSFTWWWPRPEGDEVPDARERSDAGGGRRRPCLVKIWRASVEEGEGPPGQVLASGPAGVVVACGEGVLRVRELQREGGRRLAAREFLAGHPILPGDRFGPEPPGASRDGE
ncbi:methionyl-tRNA formyltransferase [Limisphaera sp. 4302-co]|uniref:methionyl-tRNA formyltransferase n=1 Tax=Limisphaera sp. 4302-co TaxID=3400417 RepID=UPI003C267BC2